MSPRPCLRTTPNLQAAGVIPKIAGPCEVSPQLSYHERLRQIPATRRSVLMLLVRSARRDSRFVKAVVLSPTAGTASAALSRQDRSEEHTSELQSPVHI